MIVTLTGANAYALLHELRALLAAFVADYGDMGVEQLAGDEVGYERIHEALTSLPFLASRKMVVISQASANKQFLESYQQVLDRLPETTELIVVEPKLDKRSSYYRYLKRATDYREFSELDTASVSQWLVNRAKTRGGTLTASDARYLVERVGSNQQLLGNELDKLQLYNPQVTRSSIDLLTDETPQSTIFQLLEAAFAGNAKRVLSLYADQRALKVEPPQIVAMLAWQLHILAIIKTAGERSSQTIASEAKISPYVVQKSYAIAKHMTQASLRSLIMQLLEIDVRTKSEPVDADEMLQNYLLHLALDRA